MEAPVETSEPEETYKIREVWRNKTLRRVFLEILSNTQLRKCKQLKPIIIRRMERLVNQEKMSDRAIYSEMFSFIHNDLARELRCRIQHKSRYRSVNRANRIVEFISHHFSVDGKPQKHLPKLSGVLDLGCGEGSITNVVGRLLEMKKTDIHGCDVQTIDDNNILFTYTKLDPATDANALPYSDNQHDVVYAFMSLHHIQNVEATLKEVHRTLKPKGLFIIREHDCVTEGLKSVLDVVHGFYSMVWSNPQEKQDFEAEYWAEYRTAKELDKIIVGSGFERVLTTHRDEPFPTITKGKIVNPLKYYYAVDRNI